MGSLFCNNIDCDILIIIWSVKIFVSMSQLYNNSILRHIENIVLEFLVYFSMNAPFIIIILGTHRSDYFTFALYAHKHENAY